MSLSPLDTVRMRQALDLAASAIGVSEPNPRVGCVLGHQDGRIIGLGATQQAGGPHAEVMALRDAARQGHAVQGCTAWVTLEPCAHHGRTPPCCDALIAAGVRRVVVALVDPFPQVCGAGIARLRAAGIEVALAEGESAALADEAHELNIGFFSRVQRGRPWVRLKAATSMDGRTALLNGASQWLTGEAARRDGHAWRRRAGAVLTGIGTALADDPRLDVRLVNTEVQPRRALVDSQLRLPPTAKLLQSPGALRVYTQAGHPQASERRAQLLARHAEIVELPSTGRGLDLNALLQDLAGLGTNELHVEAGSVLNGALLQADLVDELLLYVAPLVVGDGRPMAQLDTLTTLSQAQRFAWLDTTMIGGDLRLRARPVNACSMSIRFTATRSRE